MNTFEFNFDQDRRSFFDFQTLLDTLSNFMAENKLSKLEFVNDLNDIGFICLETGTLFTIKRNYAYYSILNYDTNIRLIYTNVINPSSTAHGTSNAHIALIKSILLKVDEKIKEKLNDK